MIDHYRVVARVGRGGMGIVYKALDTKLQCFRALKFLSVEHPEPHARTRFLREARAAASLSHSAICAVHEVSESDGQIFIVMDFVDGQSLKERMAVGRLELTEALDIAITVAQGLDEAHEKQIIHRDLKPSNIMLDSRGRAKIVDFGLALLPDVTRLTRSGTRLGTAAYMSPEQTLGTTVDARTDIWSLGVILYEMVTGRLPFVGEHEIALLQKIQDENPEPPSKICPGLPPQMDLILGQALAKRPQDRYPNVGALLQDLTTLKNVVDSARESGTEEWLFKLPGRKSLITTTVVSVTAAAAILAWLVTQRGPPPLPRSRAVQVTSSLGWLADPSLSPDGSRIAYASGVDGNTDIYVVNALGGVPLRLTEDPAEDRDPCWLPDGSSLLFTSERSGRSAIWKIGQFGGEASLILEDAHSPAVSPDGRWLAFSAQSKTENDRIGVVGFEAPDEVLILTDDDDGLWDHSTPSWSPDSKSICYAARHDLWVVSTSKGPAKRIVSDPTLADPVWSPDGRHIYFASLRGGTLALWRVRSSGGTPQRLTWGTGPESQPTISRDGKRLAYSTQNENNDLVILRTRTGEEFRLPGLHDDDMPSMARDGSKVVFVSDRSEGHRQLYLLRFEQGRPSGSPRRLTESSDTAAHPALSPDGQWIAYYRIIDEQRDLWILPVDGGVPIRITNDPASDVHPAWAPLGNQLAFASDRAGEFDIWVVSIVEGKRSGPLTRLTHGEAVATRPCWSPDGREIAFIGYHDDSDEIWATLSDGTGVPRRLTSGADPQFIRWDCSSGKIWVRGSWGRKCCEIRLFSPDEGAWHELDTAPFDGTIDMDASFDIAGAAELVAYSSIERVGNLWVLDAEQGTF